MGLEKFISTGCHNGSLLGGMSLQKFGVVKDYWLATGSKTIDTGRLSAIHLEADRDVYHVPMEADFDCCGLCAAARRCRTWS